LPAFSAPGRGTAGADAGTAAAAGATTTGAPGSLTVNGRIQPDGTSELKANGITDEPAYSVNNIARGTPYGYRIKARFDDARGTGSRIEGRTCNYSFAKK